MNYQRRDVLHEAAEAYRVRLDDPDANRISEGLGGYLDALGDEERDDAVDDIVDLLSDVPDVAPWAVGLADAGMTPGRGRVWHEEGAPLAAVQVATRGLSSDQVEELERAVRRAVSGVLGTDTAESMG